MAAPTWQVIVYFDFPFATSAFTLNDPTRGKLDDTTYKLYASTPVDVTADVNSVVTRRGNSSALFQATQTATATIQLNNESRKYDPTYTSSPYFGNIIPNRRVTILANGVPVMDGRVSDWSFTYDRSGRSVAVMSIVCGLGILARQEMDSWTATAAQKPGARISAVLDRSDVQWPYARAIDTGVSTLQGDTVSFGTNVLNYLNTVAQSDLGMIYCSRDGVFTFRDRYAALNATASVNFGRAGDNYLSLPPASNNNASVPSSFQLNAIGDIELVARVAADTWTPGSDTTLMVRSAFADPNRAWALTLLTSGVLRFTWYPTGSAASVLTLDSTLPNPFAAGTAYWVKFTMDMDDGAGNRVGNFYYAADQSTEPTSWTPLGSTVTTVGTTSLPSVTAPAYVGTSTAGSTWNVYRAIIRNGIGGTTVVDYDFTRGITATSTTTFTEYSANAATVTINNGGTPAAVGVIPTGVPFSAIETNYGSELLFNRIGVQSAGFGGVTVIQLVSQLIYGISSYTTPTLLLNSSTQMLDLGNYLGGVYDSPEYRVQSLQIEVQGLTDAQQAQVLALDMSSIVKVGFTPNGVGTPIYRTCMVVGRNDEMGRGRHLMTLYLADVDRRSFFKLDDTVFGKLDTSVLAF